jgi:chromosome segregation ATPase
MARWRIPAACVLAAALGVLPFALHAADKKDSRERETLRRAQQELAKAKADLATLEKGKSEADAKVAATEKDLAAARDDAGRTRRKAELEAAELDAVKKQGAELRAQLESAQKSIAGLEAAGKEQRERSEALIRRWEAIVANLRATLVAGNKELKSCTDKNGDLYAFASTLLGQVAKSGSPELLLPEAPKEGFLSVEFEKVLQSYDDRVRDLKVQPPR